MNRLDEIMGTRLALISAPAGFGKTTVVIEWIVRYGGPVAWYSIDRDDGNTTLFLSYLCSALIAAYDGVGSRTLNTIRAAEGTATQTLLVSLINEIAAAGGPILIVLDDYHALESATIDGHLAYFLEHAPRDCHVIITSREDPGVALAQMRARNQMFELRADDLRFSVTEAASFFSQTMEIKVSEAHTSILEERTEGWVAGLQMAALTLRATEKPETFVSSFSASHRYIFDYLTEEVLDQQTPEIRRFLTRTSILSTLCGPLCDAVVDDGVDSGQSVLEQLERANLFVVALDAQREWYRYHHLFADLLRRRIEEDVAPLHRRAAVWLLENDNSAEAFRHAIEANDVDLALHVLGYGSTPMYANGVTARVVDWLESLDETTMDSQPELWIHLAWARWISYRSRAAADALARAATADTGRSHNSTGQIAALRAMLAANEYETETIVAESKRALELLEHDALYVRTAVTRTLAVAYQFSQNRSDARTAYRDTIAMCHQTQNTHIEILALTGLAMIDESDLRLRDAGKGYDRVLALAADPSLPITCVAHTGKGSIAYLRDDLAGAEQSLRRGADLARQIEGIDSHIFAEIALARVALARGEIGLALRALEDLAAEIERCGYTQHRDALVDLRIRALIAGDRLGEATTMAAARPINAARCALHRGDVDRTIAILRPFEREMREKAWIDRQTEAAILLAIAWVASGDQAAAAELLTPILELIEDEGAIRLVLDEGPLIRPLLESASIAGVSPALSDRLFSFLDGRRGDSVRGPTGGSTNPLSRRERQVLVLIADGLSNVEIAERLFVSESTIKGHNYRIFEKLGVSRRTEAVACARDLGIIE